MSTVGSERVVLRHPRLAALATREWPAWLWSGDGSRILWANAAGATIFGAATGAACGKRRFSVTDVPAAQVIRLAATLPAGGQERLERLRGFGASLGRPLTCVCSRIFAEDGRGAVLIAATEAAGPALSLTERVRRLFDGDEEATAAFLPDGRLLWANAAGEKFLAGAASIAALGLEPLAGTALQDGTATGTGRLTGDALELAATRIGQDASTVLLVVMRAPEGLLAAAKALERSETTTKNAPAAIAAPGREPHGLSAPARSPPERRHPLRFVWEMDADSRFVAASDEFMQLTGPRSTLLGRAWRDIAATLQLDPDDQVARAIASREAWSGITVRWPVSRPTSSHDQTSELQLPIELSGLPIFDRDRNFRGYRGFGVCRDLTNINGLAQTHQHEPQVSAAAQTDPATAGQAMAAQTMAAQTMAAQAMAAQAMAAQAMAAQAMAARAIAAQTTAAQTMAHPETEARAAPARDDIAGAAEGVGETATISGGNSADADLANVVPFRQAPAAEAKPESKPVPSLTPVERRAFRELAQELTSRLRGVHATAQAEVAAIAGELPATSRALREEPNPTALTQQELDQVLSQALNKEPSEDQAPEQEAQDGQDAGQAFGEATDQEPNAQSTDQEPSAQSTHREPSAQSAHREPSAEPREQPSRNEAEQAPQPVWSDGQVLLDRIPVAVLIYRHDELLHANRQFLELSGYSDVTDIEAAGGLNTLFAEPGAADTLGDGTQALAIVTEQGERLSIEGRMFKVPWGGAPAIALILVNGRAQVETIAARPSASAEASANAKPEVSGGASARADFVAKVSHQIRTPLTTITGLAEAMMSERFGPIANERHRQYIKDIHAAGAHLSSTLNELLDLSKIESGRIDLSFAKVNLNNLTQQCVAIMQPQANRARIIIRSALTSSLPLIVADERALRQVVLNLLSNSIRTTGPGGQIIVSTVFSETREAVLRVRDTGRGMSKRDIEAALEPFHDVMTPASWGSGGTAFGLPLTKALAEANQAHFRIKSAPDAGTLIEIAFPPDRLAA
jgi:signal transduction histidine kinase